MKSLSYSLFIIPSLLLVFSLTTCKDKKEILSGTKDGRDFKIEVKDGKPNKIREYDSIGNLLSVDIVAFYDGETIIFKDSSIYYDPKNSTINKINYYKNGDVSYTKEFNANGNLKAEGAIGPEASEIGLWHYYHDNGNLSEMAVYAQIADSIIVNSVFAFGENGKDTIYEYSKFVELSFKSDTINLGEEMQIQAFLKAPMFKDEKSRLLILLPKDEEAMNFSKTFDNMAAVPVDSIVDMNHNRKGRERYGITVEDERLDRLVLFEKKYDTPGTKHLRGVMIEYVITDKDEDNRLRGVNNYSYFGVDVYVRDTTKN